MLNWIKKTLTKNGSKTRLTKTGNSKTRGQSARRAKSASSAAKNKAVILSRGEHGISRDNIDDHALKVLYRLHRAGYQACLVGGAVRDLLLGITPKDFDVATDATPEQVKQLFRNCRLIGRRFRLAHIHFGRQIIEVATYRAAHESSQSGHQDETGRIVRDNVFGELADDVWRRDFTANALYYDISDFSVIDFVGGFEDINKKRLHLIGDVETRYREDPVRMLRALRFSAKLGFDIDEESRSPIYSLGYLLEDQSIEQDENVKDMLIIAMRNTDDRIRKDMRVTPAFLFAALLWHPVNSRVKEIVDNGMPYSVAIQKVATKVLSQQAGSVSIPRRFTTTMRDIWGLQTRFHYRVGKRALAVLEHPKFRAGYDFLCIRAQSGEEVDGGNIKQDCQWWTDIQKQSAEQQQKVLFSTSGKSGAAKPKKRRRSSSKKKVKKPET